MNRRSFCATIAAAIVGPPAAAAVAPPEVAHPVSHPRPLRIGETIHVRVPPRYAGPQLQRFESFEPGRQGNRIVTTRELDEFRLAALRRSLAEARP